MSCMNIVFSQKSFLNKHPIQLTYLPKFMADTTNHGNDISCGCSQEAQQSAMDNGFELGKRAMGALAFAVLALGPADGAFAATTGGRVGGQFFRSSFRLKPISFKRRRRTFMNDQISFNVTPPMDPPLVGGYGCDIGIPYYSTWGWTPFSFFGPGPCVAAGIGAGIKVILLFMFLGAVAAVVRKHLMSRNEDEN